MAGVYEWGKLILDWYKALSPLLRFLLRWLWRGALVASVAKAVTVYAPAPIQKAPPIEPVRPSVKIIKEPPRIIREKVDYGKIQAMILPECKGYTDKRIAAHVNEYHK